MNASVITICEGAKQPGTRVICVIITHHNQNNQTAAKSESSQQQEEERKDVSCSMASTGKTVRIKLCNCVSLVDYVQYLRAISKIPLAN